MAQLINKKLTKNVSIIKDTRVRDFPYVTRGLLSPTNAARVPRSPGADLGIEGPSLQEISRIQTINTMRPKSQQNYESGIHARKRSRVMQALVSNNTHEIIEKFQSNKSYMRSKTPVNAKEQPLL